jgi:hypothetical protein
VREAVGLAARYLLAVDVQPASTGRMPATAHTHRVVLAFGILIGINSTSKVALKKLIVAHLANKFDAYHKTPISKMIHKLPRYWVGFEVLMMKKITTLDFWVVMLCRSVGSCQRVGGTGCLDLQG